MNTAVSKATSVTISFMFNTYAIIIAPVRGSKCSTFKLFLNNKYRHNTVAYFSKMLYMKVTLRTNRI